MLYQEGGASRDKSNTSLADLNSAVSVRWVRISYKCWKIYQQIQARKEALQRDQEYVKYIESIQGAGYFRGEIEGSQLWNELESRALETFLSSRREE
jgi:hypothetical protein